MPLQDFDGQTWVAFSDLCGTKAMYKESPDKAAEALDRFYNAVYELQRAQGEISALAVSDCAIFWLHDPTGYPGEASVAPRMLECLLTHVKTLHMRMVEEKYLVSTTVAYGHFRYQQRLEIPRLRKDMIVGGAYLDAYAANDKVREGTIVILKPADAPDAAQCAGRFSKMIKPYERSRNQREFFWWLDSPDRIQEAKQAVKQAADSRFRELLRTYGSPR